MMSRPLLFLPALLAVFLTSCASPDATSWIQPVNSQQASFLWKHSGGTLSGDAVITYDMAGNVLIRLMKSLPRPLLEITSTSQGRFEATGPLAAGGWSGAGDRVPVRFSLWKALADAWRGSLAARDGRQEVHTGSYRAAVWKESGRILELSVSSNDNGEVIRLVFK